MIYLMYRSRAVQIGEDELLIKVVKSVHIADCIA